MECERCSTPLAQDQVSMGANLGFGPFYLCLECLPIPSAEEIVESITLAMKPIKELPNDE